MTMFRLSHQNTIGLLGVILSLTLVAGFIVYPALFNRISEFSKSKFHVEIGTLTMPFHLGLDLQGGTHLVYEADTSQVKGITPDEAMDAVRDTIERRVNLFGVAEPLVQIANSGESRRLIVELAGVKDVSQAIKRIGETPFLEFREEGPDAKPNDISSFVPTELNGSYLTRAQVQFDQTTNEPLVGLEFNAEGGKIFEEITKRNFSKPLAIFLDGFPISAPTVQSVITGGQAVITGKFSFEEATALARSMNAGALPVPIKLIAQSTIGASLGQESLEKALYAAFWGFGILAFFMIGYYRFSGLIGIAALLIYIGFMLTFFKIIPVTLTLAGIAGFILSLGIAIDANILIFERMNEELARGRSLESAIREGFLRSWTSIRDGNVTTLITAFILYWIGSSFVQGFAFTLTIGILLSMFTAVFVSRLFLEVLAGTRINKKAFIWKSGLWQS